MDFYSFTKIIVRSVIHPNLCDFSQIIYISTVQIIPFQGPPFPFFLKIVYFQLITIACPVITAKYPLKDPPISFT